MAVSCRVNPEAMLGTAGVTSIETSTAAVTVIVAVPVTPCRLAETDVLPAAMAVALPTALTAATAELLELHVT